MRQFLSLLSLIRRIFQTNPPITCQRANPFNLYRQLCFYTENTPSPFPDYATASFGIECRSFVREKFMEFLIENRI